MSRRAPSGLKIVAIKVTRYEVRDPMRKVLYRTASLPAAKAWVQGYVRAPSRRLDKAADPDV